MDFGGGIPQKSETADQVKNPQSSEPYREAQRKYRKEGRLLRMFEGLSVVLLMTYLGQLGYTALSRDPKIKLGSLVVPSGRRTQSEGETLRALANYIFSQFGGYTGVSGPYGRPPG